MARHNWKKIIGFTLLGLVALVAIGITATIGWRPFIGPAARPLTDRTFPATPERLARGRYLVAGVNGCFGCHSELDYSQPGAVPKVGREGAGRVWTDEGSPWLTAPNLTADRETGIANWTDDTIARAIREGIGHDGRALFPIMPYERYRHMSDEDLASVVVFIRSLPPVRNALPPSQVPFPLNRLIGSVPQPITSPVPTPDISTPQKKGKHLVEMAACTDCHTPMDSQGQRIAGLEFAGGFPLRNASGTAASSNITPDPTGIPYYTEDLFLEVMRTGHVKARPLSNIMPWAYYRNMNDEDLKAVFAFITTLKPVKHSVDNSVRPTLCKLCGSEHGNGDRN